MKTQIKLLVGGLAFLMLTSGCQKEANISSNLPTDIASVGSGINALKALKYGTMKDIDGNSYKTIKIGNQVWMAENLRVTKFRNGKSIPNVIDATQWSNLSSSAFCYFNGSTYDDKINGKLYNWFAVNDSKKLAPNGWHIPSDNEWATLVNYLGGNSIASGKLKTTGTTYWLEPNTGATNESGFSAVAAGYRLFDGSFYQLGTNASFWTSTSYINNSAWIYDLHYYLNVVNRYYPTQKNAYSVRCIKD